MTRLPIGSGARLRYGLCAGALVRVVKASAAERMRGYVTGLHAGRRLVLPRHQLAYVARRFKDAEAFEVRA